MTTQNDTTALADRMLSNVGLPTYSELLDALRLIGSQSIGDDWTKEQAYDFMRQHARETARRYQSPNKQPDMHADLCASVGRKHG